MKSEELKRIQAPIKAKYRDQADTALVTLKAKGKIGEGISCKVETGRALVEAGLHPGTGGDGMLICSGDKLLEALVGFKSIRLSFYLDCNASPEQLNTLTRLTERFCVVYQTLTKGVQIETNLNKQ